MFVELPCCFNAVDELDYEALGIERPEDTFEVDTALVNLMNVNQINPSSTSGISTITFTDGSCYSYAIDYNELKHLIMLHSV